MGIEGVGESVKVIQPRRGWAGIGFAELWQFRELLGVLTAKSIRVRYRQTILGVGWAVIQPFMVMVVFSVFFGRLAKMPSDGLPYPLFAYAALVPWWYFANALTASANSLVDNRDLITKVYFPRLLLPLAPALSGLVDFAIAMTILFGLMAWYGVVPTAAIAALPLLVALAMVTAVAVGLWVAGLVAWYRDFRYVVGFMVQFWMFATPVAYPSSLVPEAWRAWYGLNPMAGVVEGFRWALLGKDQPPGPIIYVSAAVALVLLVTGVEFFRRMERTVVDQI